MRRDLGGLLFAAFGLMPDQEMKIVLRNDLRHPNLCQSRSLRIFAPKIANRSSIRS